jgi:hypothetical protein
VGKNWDKVKNAVSATKDFISTKVGQIPGAIAGFATKIKDTLTAPFDAVVSLIDKIIEKIKKINIPGIPGIRIAGASTTSVPVIGSLGSASYTTTNTYNTFNLNGLLSDDQAADFIREILDRRARQLNIA